jgi:hypothetical protein
MDSRFATQRQHFSQFRTIIRNIVSYRLSPSGERGKGSKKTFVLSFVLFVIVVVKPAVSAIACCWGRRRNLNPFSDGREGIGAASHLIQVPK